MEVIMLVADLKRIIQQVPDDVYVVTPAFDHSYQSVEVNITTALQSRRRGADFIEDFGEADTPEAEYGKRVNVVVIG